MDTSFILINAIVGLVCGTINIAYFLTHSNGKKWFRLLCGIIISGLGAGYVCMLLGWIPVSFAGSVLVQPWVAILFVIPALDARIDWHSRRTV